MVSLLFFSVVLCLGVGPGREPLLQLLQSFGPVADLVLLRLVHLCVCLSCADILEARVPACVLVSILTPTLSCMSIRLPKTVGPRLGTSLPSVRPWNVIGSWPGPAQYPNVHTACADLSSKPASILCSSRGPRDCMNHLLRTMLVQQEWSKEIAAAVHVGPRKVVHGFEAEACVFHKHRAADLCRC
jgi:hypothetical protein